MLEAVRPDRHAAFLHVNELLSRRRVLGNVFARKDLKSEKLYAGETGAITEHRQAKQLVT